MRALSDNDFIKHDIHLAKRALIKARIARQKATVERELDMYFGSGQDNADNPQALLAKARALRKEAQELLVKVEKLNGERYLAGEKVFSLKDYLAGRFFKCWREFDAEYAKIGSPFFGSDPE